MDKDKAYANIMFDLDGTLTEPALGITGAAQYALEKMGIRVEDRRTLEWMIGPPLLESFMEGYGMDEDRARETLGYYREYFSQKGIYQNEIYPGIAELLRDLRTGGRRLIVATSKPEEFTHIVLRYFHIHQYFHFVGGNDFANSRPSKADVIRHIMQSLPQISPDNTVMVGDRRFDAEGAAAFGIGCIGVLYGYGTREELEKAGVIAIAESPDDLKNILL